MYIYSYMHTRKRPFTKRPTCFPFPWCDAPRTSSGAEEWAGRRAEDKQQDSCSKCGPDSMCWILWGKGSRGYKAGFAGDGGDRGQVGGPCSIREPSDCRGRDRADPTGLARTDMEDPTPSHFLKGLPFAVCVVHPAWNMSVPQPSWDRNTRRTWPTGRLPKWTPETPSGWKYFISSIQRQSANFSPTEKKIQLYQIIYTPWIIQGALINSWNQKTQKGHILQGSLSLDCNINLLTSNVTNVTLLASI